MFASALGSAVLAVTQVCALTASTSFGTELASQTVIDGVTVSGDGALCRWHSPTQFGDAGFRFRFGRWERVYDYWSRAIAPEILASTDQPRPLDGDVASGALWYLRPSSFGPDQETLKGAGFSATQVADFSDGSSDVRDGNAAYFAFEKRVHNAVIPEHYDFIGPPWSFFEPSGKTSAGPFFFDGFRAELKYSQGMFSRKIGAYFDAQRLPQDRDKVTLTLSIDGRDSHGSALASPLELTLYAPFLFAEDGRYVARVTLETTNNTGGKTGFLWKSEPVAATTHDNVLRVSLPVPRRLDIHRQLSIVIDRTDTSQ
ncbi:MAG TPA: hypothetical protein VKG44_06350 [Candidatus Baltobacteraceae bacterium]|nr:hypothetical protein [Candidatus Baltobacteraceae bacterium]